MQNYRILKIKILILFYSGDPGLAQLKLLFEKPCPTYLI